MRRTLARVEPHAKKKISVLKKVDLLKNVDSGMRKKDIVVKFDVSPNFWQSPEIREDLISMYTTSAHGVMALSLEIKLGPLKLNAGDIGTLTHVHHFTENCFDLNPRIDPQTGLFLGKGAQRRGKSCEGKGEAHKPSWFHCPWVYFEKTKGYFVYDLMDMMINHRKRSSYELMIHHVVVIICFGLSVMTRYYLGYGLMALLVEVNSIFLHIRQLMLIQSLRKSHILYRLNSLLTIGTFIVFRITTLGWMTRWLVLHRDELSVTAFTIGSASMPVIMVMNIVLFLRILNSDYRQRQPTNNDGFLNTLHQEELLCNQDKTD
uniref:TLC domain-containing protein n=1 Tax=Timema genevievae TaxID=629358 RepID=A0A7R9JY31_TIMGE|nr:unnamed protein product [Timema genevievae]